LRPLLLREQRRQRAVLVELPQPRRLRRLATALASLARLLLALWHRRRRLGAAGALHATDRQVDLALAVAQQQRLAVERRVRLQREWAEMSRVEPTRPPACRSRRESASSPPLNRAALMASKSSSGSRVRAATVRGVSFRLQSASRSATAGSASWMRVPSSSFERELMPG